MKKENFYRFPAGTGITMIAAFVFGGMLMAKPVSANEGVVNLRGAGTGASCYAASVFVEGAYKILATCRELKIALTPESNRYVAWSEDVDGKQRRLGEVVNGKLSTLTDTKFVRMFVTAETDGYGDKPSTDILLTGFVEPIDFGKGIVSAPIITPTPTPTKVGATISPAKNTTNTDAAPSQSGLGSALSTVLKIALLGFGVLLLIVGVFSFLSRRRSL
jgi:hypothetical protein